MFFKPTGEVYLEKKTALAGSLMEWGIPSPSIRCRRRPKPYGGFMRMRRTEQAHPIHNNRTNMYKLPLQALPPSTTENGLQYLAISLSHREFSTLKSAGFRSSHEEEPCEACSSSTAGTLQWPPSSRQHSVHWSPKPPLLPSGQMLNQNRPFSTWTLSSGPCDEGQHQSTGSKTAPKFLPSSLLTF